MARLARLACCAAAAWTSAALDVAAAQSPPASATADKPRAFGYFVGDLVERHVALDLPADTALDPASLPTVGGRGKGLELRRVTLENGGLTMVYQVFLAPRETRTLEMPSFTLRTTGGARPADLWVDAWPVTVAPLMPPEVSPRDGLGDLRPDAAPQAIDTMAAQWRLAAYALIGALLLGWLAHVYLGLPWWQRRRRPFGLAWKALAALPRPLPADQRHAAWMRLHGALNQTAGEVVFEAGLDRFMAAHPAYVPLRAELHQFFQRSRAEFFGASDGSAAGAGAGANGNATTGAENGATPATFAAVGDVDWLRAFCRRCRDAERGSA